MWKYGGNLTRKSADAAGDKKAIFPCIFHSFSNVFFHSFSNGFFSFFVRWFFDLLKFPLGGSVLLSPRTNLIRHGNPSCASPFFFF